MKKNYILLIFIYTITFLFPLNILASETINDNNTMNLNSDVEEYNIQMVKVITSKISENGEALVGANLQIIDSSGKIIDEWITDGTSHETLLPNGQYILHEKEAPIGYKTAEDKTFTVEVKVNEINAGVVHEENINCKHYPISLYYIESEGKKQEVYCINQDWDEPIEYIYKTDENGNIVTDEKGKPIIIEEKTVSYDGEILSVEKFRDFVPDADKTMSNQELYDKILDIIYRRIKAETIFKDKISNSEIRFITEYALKNYTSAEVTNNREIKYFRYYKYDSELGYVIDEENGNALGKLAQHWKHVHKSIIPATYVELYNYLTTSPDTHPNDMKLYLYSTKHKPNGSNSLETDQYQNLLGITGYFNDFKPQELEIILENKYSDEITEINIDKIWEDNNDEDMIRPDEITVSIFADNNKISDIQLKKEEDWHKTIKDLPVYNKGKKINYTIIEQNIEFYETNINRNATNGFVITNKHLPWPKGGGEEPNPQTSDTLFNNIIIFIGSFISIILIIINNKFKNIKKEI